MRTFALHQVGRFSFLFSSFHVCLCFGRGLIAEFRQTGGCNETNKFMVQALPLQGESVTAGSVVSSGGGGSRTEVGSGVGGEAGGKERREGNRGESNWGQKTRRSEPQRSETKQCNNKKKHRNRSKPGGRARRKSEHIRRSRTAYNAGNLVYLGK